MAPQISRFRKLKLKRCARAGNRAGFFHDVSPTTPEESQRFIDTAREVEASEDPKDFERGAAQASQKIALNPRFCYGCAATPAAMHLGRGWRLLSLLTMEGGRWLGLSPCHPGHDGDRDPNI